VSDQPEAQRPTLRGVPDVIMTCVAIPAAILLVTQAQGTWATFSAVCFGIGLVAMLGMSAAYHTPNWTPEKLTLMRRLDHAAIFLLIAGSYTPFCLCTDLSLGRPLLGFVYGASLLGVARTLLWPRGHRGVRAALFVLLGLVMVPFVPELYAAVGAQVLVLAALGGALYIVGAGVYVARRPNPFPRHFGYQEVFHLFVFAALGCHYVAVWQVVTGQVPITPAG
jgi:hemolysin III